MPDSTFTTVCRAPRSLPSGSRVAVVLLLVASVAAGCYDTNTRVVNTGNFVPSLVTVDNPGAPFFARVERVLPIQSQVSTVCTDGQFFFVPFTIVIDGRTPGLFLTTVQTEFTSQTPGAMVVPTTFSTIDLTSQFGS